MIDKKSLISFFDELAPSREYWNKRNSIYHREIEKIINFYIEPNKNVLEIGCGLGDLVAKTFPKNGVGVDISSEMIKRAKKKFPRIKFVHGDAEYLKIRSKFDYIIASDLIGSLGDIQKAFDNLRNVSKDETRLILIYYNFLWEPLVKIASSIGLTHRQFNQNWLSKGDVENLLYLSGFEVVTKGDSLIFPLSIPILSKAINKYLSRLPMLRNFCLIQFIIVRPIINNTNRDYSVSIVIPARNEEGNIENAVKRIPNFGKKIEILFVEGRSSDNTRNEIIRVKNKYKDKNVKLILQGRGAGKGDAVRRGFSKSTGEVLIILDADLTVKPEELPKFYRALVKGRGELIMGSRLIYQLEKDSMRFLNILGNKFFSLIFTWILGQRIKDTLCGTKVLFRKNYVRIAKGRKYFGDFDPFGDFDLLFGASKLGLKIIELPIRYQPRRYGSTNISRFRHGLLLLRMSWLGIKKIKFF